MSERVVVAQLGARRGYAIPSILERHGLLYALHTDLTADHPLARGLSGLVPEDRRPSALRRLGSREAPRIPRHRIRQLPLFGLRRLLRRRRARSPQQRIEHYLWQNREFCRKVLVDGLDWDCDTLYAFNGAALELLERAPATIRYRVLDQTSAPARLEASLLAREREEWRGWERHDRLDETLANRWFEREEREWQLTDLILCGSEWVAEGIRARGGSSDKIAIVPYGVDVERFQPSTPPPEADPLRVLFCGTLNLRKGIQYLMQAAGRLDRKRIRIEAIGPSELCVEAQSELARHIDLRGSLPRSEMPHVYRQAHIFVLPSISEGSANVVYEALASGLPVVTTHNAGTVVRDRQEGLVVPARDPEALAAAILELAENPNLRRDLALRARQMALDFTWKRYGDQLVEALTGLWKGSDRSRAVEVATP